MKKTKIKIFACVMAVMCFMTAFSATAFASDGGYYESNEDGDNTPPSSIDSITVSTAGVNLPENQGSDPLTPDGNLSLIDDILQNESYASDEGVTVGNKQFITVQSKNGNYFYIVIDRSGDTENVYFLNLVDEADLMALMEDGNDGNTSTCTCSDKCVAGDVDTDCPVCKNNMSECAGKDAAATTPDPSTSDDPDGEKDGDSENDKSGSNTSLLLIVLVIALAAGGAVYWFKLRKPKAKGKDNLDDYNYGEDEDDEEIEYETETDDEETESDDE